MYQQDTAGFYAQIEQLLCQLLVGKGLKAFVFHVECPTTPRVVYFSGSGSVTNLVIESKLVLW